MGILRTKKFWIELLIMTFGMFVAALGVHFFLKPSHMIIGSISGLSIVIYRLTGIAVSTCALVINAFLLVLAYLLIGKEFGLKTVYTALILGPLLFVLEQTFPVEQSLMQDPWFDLLCFVLILGFSQSVLFKINASTGGLDIIAKIVNKYFHINLGTSVSVSGGLICATAFYINDFRMVIIGLVGTWINGLAVNYFSDWLNQRKRVHIISREHERIREYIVTKIIRGVTLYEIEEGYTRKKMIQLETLLTNQEFASLMEFITTQDIQAFITADNVSEVYGLWVRKKDKAVHPGTLYAQQEPSTLYMGGEAGKLSPPPLRKRQEE